MARWNGADTGSSSTRSRLSQESPLGIAPDGIPFAWLYTPWAETPVCRTTDFGVIHHGPLRDNGTGPSVLSREIVDDSVRMYPVGWEDTKFYRYLDDATRLAAVIPLGRLGLYKYTTLDSTYSMVRRLAAFARGLPARYPGTSARHPAWRARRLEQLSHISRQRSSRSTARRSSSGEAAATTRAPEKRSNHRS